MERSLAEANSLIQELFELSCSPSLSIGVLHEGQPIHTAHYGRRRISEHTPPNDDTLYNVASLTKLMAAGVVANLVAEGLLAWNVPIREYLPEFAERKDDVGLHATVTDLLANRTGLSAQTTFWGAMYKEIFQDRQQIPRLASHIPAIGEFRKSSIYSSWGCALLTSFIERVTGKSFGFCVDKYIYQPLGMNRSTLNFPQNENVVFKHWVGLDGMAHEFSWSNTRRWCDDTGFGAAVGARSSTIELLKMYQSLLHAYNHQMSEDIDFTPGSPFKFARHLLSPHIGVGGAALDQQGYCLGTYRSQLPASLSAASYNSILLVKQNQQLFGKKNAGRVVFHQVATFTTYNGFMLMEPQSQTTVFVLVNSLPLFDVTDMVAQLVLGIIL